MTQSESNETNRGILLANLGTPESPQRKAVARFLREFLSDPRVVDLPRALWLPLLYLVIVPLRAGRSAAAYRKIWRPDGSPLLVFTERLAQRLALLPGLGAEVEAGMRYGTPSIREALGRLRDKGVRELTVLPLYPQYSRTTTASIYDAVEAALDAMKWQPELRRIEHYYRDAGWVKAVADSIRAYQDRNGVPDRLVFSMHGLPQRLVDAGDPYQKQCEESVEAIAGRLGLQPGQWQICYQSRVGREPWLQPYTDLTLEELARTGKKHVQVACPGFAADCLETLEEIAIQNRDRFLAAGGDKLEYIPSLNDSEVHARALARLVTEPVDSKQGA